MLRLITRHGQISEDAEFVGGHLYPAGEDPLSELGREQARMLGERLKEMGFKGRILASPYMRTMETADIVAEITGLKVIPFAPIREIFKTQKQIDEYRGMTLEKMRSLYQNLDSDATLEYPWWTPDIENSDEVLARIEAGVKIAEERYPKEEILFVGHGASSSALVKAYGIPKSLIPYLFNCSLSYIDPENSDIRPVYCDTSFIPYEKTYSNFLSREELDREYFEAPYEEKIELPSGISEIKGIKLLHIGDTYSKHYPFYKKLIELVKPDIILHTGDMADEVKVGRMPETEYEYISKTKAMLGYLRDSGARIIIVPGNNDLPEAIKKLLPTAEVYPINSVITLDGEECRIGHQVTRMTFDKKWSFYGHGFTGEEWSYEKNQEGGQLRFNAYWGAFVCSLSENKFYKIPLPKIKR